MKFRTGQAPGDMDRILTFSWTAWPLQPGLAKSHGMLYWEGYQGSSAAEHL